MTPLKQFPNTHVCIESNPFFSAQPMSRHPPTLQSLEVNEYTNTRRKEEPQGSNGT